MPPKEGAAPGPGARVLARLEKRGESYEARIVRRLESEAGPERMLGVLRENRARLSASCRWTRKARGEYALDKRDAGRRQEQRTGGCANPSRPQAPAFPACKVVERIGSMDSAHAPSA